MKKKLLFTTLLISMLCGFMACKKQIDKIKANAVVDVMVSSKWEIQQYLSGASDVTTEFAGYEFQFYRDLTVVGTNGTTSMNGTWNGDASAGTITANFPNSSNPLARLNGTWGFYSYDSSGPKFNQTINGVEAKLILKKK